jgi:hypothetical protein
VKPLALDIAADGLQQLPTDFDYVLHFAEALARKSGAAIPPEESRNAATAA